MCSSSLSVILLSTTDPDCQLGRQKDIFFLDLFDFFTYKIASYGNNYYFTILGSAPESGIMEMEHASFYPP